MVAVIVVVPAPTVDNRPVLLIVATEVSEEVHATPTERSWLEPSLYSAVAVNCSVMPIGSVRPSGETEIETMDGAVTATVTDAETVPSVAVMVEVPTAIPLTMPVELIAAVGSEDELHVTIEVRSAVLPSL